MPIIYSCSQHSEEWERLRIGIPTASRFDEIWTPPQLPTKSRPHPKYPYGQESKQWLAYSDDLIAERILLERVEKYIGPWMERGKELEPEAIAWYEFHHETETQPVGFVTTDDGEIGCSPDRLAGDDGLLEFKCPAPGTHVGYMLRGEADKKYWPQLQGQLYVTGRRWVEIISYHPIIENKIIRVERDEPYIEAMASELRQVVRYLSGISAKHCPDWRERLKLKRSYVS